MIVSGVYMYGAGLVLAFLWEKAVLEGVTPSARYALRGVKSFPFALMC